MSDDNYEVGYKKPPVHTRFQKGRSGNPKGRPKGGQNLATVLQRELNQMVTITERGRQYKVTKLVASVKQLVNSAATGDHRAMQMLIALNRTETHSEVQPLSSEADHEVMQDLLARMGSFKQGPNEEQDDGPF